MTGDPRPSPRTPGRGADRLAGPAAGRDLPGPSLGGAPRADESAYAVPDGDAPSARCPYCGRPFGRVRLRRLHVGERHRDECTDAERRAYESAYDEESDDLFVYQIRLVAALVVLFFVFVYTYALVFTL